MSKIKNWTRLDESDPVYREKFIESRFDRQVKPIVWEFDGTQELFYVIYKNIDGYYISEYVSPEVQEIEESIAGVEDYGTITSKNKAHSVATDILENHPFPFGNYDKDELKVRVRSVFREMAESYLDREIYIELGSLQRRSNKYAKTYGEEHVIRLWVDWRSFKNFSFEKRISILSHELAHYNEPDHDEDFWKENFTITEFIEGRIDHHYPREIDWKTVHEKTYEDINENNVNMNKANVGELRDLAIERFGLDRENDYVLKKYKMKMETKIELGYPDNWKKTSDSLVEIQTGPKELWNWIKRNHNQVDAYGEKKYYVPIPKMNSSMEPIDETNRKRAEVIEYMKTEESEAPYME